MKKGHFDALLINKEKEVFEGAYSNLFWFEGNTLCTREKDILPGITRELVIKNSPFKVKFKNITLKQLLNKKEVFTTQSVNLVVPIIKIDKTKIGNGKPGTKTSQIMNLTLY